MEDNEKIITANEVDTIHNKMDDCLVDNFQRWAERKLEERTIVLDDMDDFIHKHPFDDVKPRLWSLVDIWAITYKGPVARLADIVKNEQSVHTRDVEKKTNDGIYILSKMDVPKGQKTLKEIEKAFRKRAAVLKKNANAPWHANKQVKDIIGVILHDMTDWGKRPAVMKKDENIYRPVLRGLWAKIKSYSPEIQNELIYRLFEECNESIGLCADGHVGRLVNVLAGFDDDFHSKMSPMEYFQNNIALIAANEGVAMEFKVIQARKLMDEVKMPEGERAAWLEAL